MNTKLEYYYEDIDNIFDMCKEKFNYDNFTVTSKSKFNNLLVKCNNTAKKIIKECWEDTEEAVARLAEIQLKMDKILFTFKVSDEIYKSSIYSLSQETEVDSTHAYNFNKSNYKTIITIN